MHLGNGERKGVQTSIQTSTHRVLRWKNPCTLADFVTLKFAGYEFPDERWRLTAHRLVTIYVLPVSNNFSLEFLAKYQ